MQNYSWWLEPYNRFFFFLFSVLIRWLKSFRWSFCLWKWGIIGLDLSMDSTDSHASSLVPSSLPYHSRYCCWSPGQPTFPILQMRFWSREGWCCAGFITFTTGINQNQTIHTWFEVFCRCPAIKSSWRCVSCSKPLCSLDLLRAMARSGGCCLLPVRERGRTHRPQVTAPLLPRNNKTLGWVLQETFTCQVNISEVNVGVEMFLILVAQKMCLEICFFQTFSVGGWSRRREGRKEKVHGSKWVPASSGRLLEDMLAPKAKVFMQELQQGKIIWKCCNGFTACSWPFWCGTLSVGLTAGAVVFFLFVTLPLACSCQQAKLLASSSSWAIIQTFLKLPWASLMRKITFQVQWNLVLNKRSEKVFFQAFPYASIHFYFSSKQFL